MEIKVDVYAEDPIPPKTFDQYRLMVLVVLIRTIILRKFLN